MTGEVTLANYDELLIFGHKSTPDCLRYKIINQFYYEHQPQNTNPR